jgi:predicted nucleotidyltransferase
LVTFQPGVQLGWDFFELHKEIEDLLGCEVDLLTRRPVEQDENAIRRRSILQSTREIYTA